MSFINNLDISEEEEHQLQIVSRSKFLCNVSTSLFSIPAKVVLDFRKVNERGIEYSYLRVEWRHSIPQPLGFHVLPSGNWNVTNVSFGGTLFKKACRLDTAVKLLEEHKSSLVDTGKVRKLEERIAELEKLLESAEDNARAWEASAVKAKGKLHALRASIAEIEKAAENSPPLPPIQDEPSTSKSKPPASNADLFKSWAGDGNVD
nr:putative 22.6 kDa protein [Red clover torradovirus 1]